jgi:diguanylate cyclase (GGDEF)-like protein
MADPPLKLGLQAKAPAARRRWTVRVTWVLLLGGLLMAVATGTYTYRSAESRARASFRDNASLLSSSLATALQRDEDLVMSQEGMLEAFPTMTNREYRVAIAAADLARRYPGGAGFNYVERVPANQLVAFALEQSADPIEGVPVPYPAAFQPFPISVRAQYCLTRLGVKTSSAGYEIGLSFYDFCALVPGVRFPAVLAAATSTASMQIAPPIADLPGIFYIVAPVYRHGAPLATVKDRRAQVEGWALGTFSGAETLKTVLGQERYFGLKLGYSTGSAAPALVASVGQGRGGSVYSATFGVGETGRWHVSVMGNASAGVSQALLVGLLVFGIALLLFVLVRFLAGSRQRALLLVDERTREVRYQALHDSLTGLPNRDLIVDRAGQVLARAEREGIDVGVLFIDLDNFKQINDSFGHERGDQLLRAVGERLSRAVRPSDSVGRLGGDEFVVLVQGDVLEAGPVAVAERVLEVLAEPFVLPGMEHTPLVVRASIGVTSGSRPDVGDLLRDADVALYQAKQEGGSRYVIFEPEMQLAVQERVALEMDLRSALSEGQLFVEYQPIFDLGTLQITGAEALIRWQHPTRGLIGPARFIPVAEAGGLINAVGKFVLKESCHHAATWASMGKPLTLAVNVSGRQLQSDNFAEEIAAALQDNELDPTLLTLELTETVLMNDVELTLLQLQALKDLGLKLAIDDFGTGYSSLSYLRRFPFDALKIDRSFISGVARSPEAYALVHTLVQLGKALGLTTYAEGIEDEAQLSVLQREQCDLGQGFYYSRPLSASALEALLSSQPVGAQDATWGGAVHVEA